MSTCTAYEHEYGRCAHFTTPAPSMGIMQELRNGEAQLHKNYVAGSVERGAYVVAVAAIHARYAQLRSTTPCVCLACRETRASV